MKTTKSTESVRNLSHGVSVLMTFILVSILIIVSLAAVFPFVSALNLNYWSSEIMVSSSSGTVTNPFTFTDIEENAYVIWQDNSAGRYQIFMKKFDSDSNALTASLLIVNSAGDAKNPAATIDAYERIIMVWEDTRDGNNEIYFKILNNTGSELYSDTRITNTSGDSLFPTIESYLNYVYLLWVDNTPGNFRLYQQRIGFSVPSLTINAPLDSGSYDTSSVQLDVTFSESVSAWYVLDGDTSSTTNNTLVLSQLMENVTAGSHTLTVYCEDQLSTTNQSSVTFIVNDLEPPVFTDIENISVQPSEQILYDINATDLNGISCFSVNDTANFDIDCSGILTNKTGLVIGHIYILNITVNDTSGNLNSEIITVLVSDTIPPTVTLSHDHPDPIVKDLDSVTITANFSEPMAAVALMINYSDATCLNVTYNMSLVSSNEYEYVWDVPASCDANASITVSGSDIYSNLYSESDEIVFVVDNTAPILAELTPVSSITTDNTPEYEFSSTEPGSITYNGSCDSATASAVSGSNMITFNTLLDNVYNHCTITVTDAAGNPSDALSVSQFSVDTQGPVFTNIQNKILLDNTSLLYDIDATDTNGVSCFAVNDMTFEISCSGVLVNITALDLGYYWLNISANDTLGNIDSREIFIYVVNSSLPLNDTAPPTVQLSSDHADDIVRDPDSVLVTADFSEAMTANPGLQIDYSDDACPDVAADLLFVSDNLYSYPWDVPALCDGTATITVSGTDLYDNPYVDPDELVFTIDNTAPVISEVSPVADFTDTDTPDYEFTSNEEGTISYDACSSVSADAVAGSNIITFDQLSQGAHDNCTIIVTDASGNPSDTLVVSGFFVDTLTPSVDAGSDRTTNHIFTQAALAFDSGSGIASYSWTMESGSGVITFGSSDALNTTISADEDDIYTVRLTVEDRAGNSEQDEMTLTWRVAPPVINYVVLTPEEVLVDGIISVIAKGLNSQPGDLFVYALIDDSSESRINLTNMTGGIYSAEIALAGYGAGEYVLDVYFEDLFGNNASIAKTFSIKETTTVVSTFLNESAEIVANASSNISDNRSGTVLTINASQVMNTTISITETTTAESTASVGIPSLGKFITIDAPELEGNLNSVLIKIDYNDSEVSERSIDESTLRLYYYNATSDTWTEYDGDDGFVPDGGVNTTANYVWALTDHLSTWGIFGETPESPSSGSRRVLRPADCTAGIVCTKWSICTNGLMQRDCVSSYENCSTRQTTEEKSCTVSAENESSHEQPETLPKSDTEENAVVNGDVNISADGLSEPASSGKLTATVFFVILVVGILFLFVEYYKKHKIS